MSGENAACLPAAYERGLREGRWAERYDIEQRAKAVG